MLQQQRNREEAINNQLAILISRLGVTADAETIPGDMPRTRTYRKKTVQG
jgi:hypothetical protein